jgi:spore coat protein U-like protein
MIAFSGKFREFAGKIRRLFILVSFVIICYVAMPPRDAFAPGGSCTVSMTAITFGNVNVLAGTAVDITATMTLSCNFGPAGGRLCISLGAGSAGDATSRKLLGPGNATLRYDLYSNSSRTILWGSWQTGYDTAGVQLDVGNGTTTTPVTVYARLFGSQQTAATGSYTSTFTANPFVQYGDKGSTSCPTGSNNTSTSTSASATVVTSCNVSATTLNFGSAGVLAGNVDATNTVTATCTSATSYNIGLDAGTGSGATVTTRKMTSGANTINYSLYTDSARSTVWGNTVGTNTVSGTGSGLGQNFTVFGRVPSQTTPAPGTYSDTVVVTITY